MKKTGCKIICGAPTTLAVKGLMMMLMMNRAKSVNVLSHAKKTNRKNNNNKQQQLQPKATITMTTTIT